MGLYTESGQIVRKEVVEFTGQEFYQIREIEKGETTGLPVVETIVQKDGFFTTRERNDWCEPNLTEGIEPRFEVVLNRLNEAKVTKASPIMYAGHIITILLKDDNYVVEYIQGSHGVASDPTMWIQKTPGQTWVASHDRYSNGTDTRLLQLEKMLETAEEVIGSREEEILRESEGRFTLKEFSDNKYAVYCPHGKKVTHYSEKIVRENPDDLLRIAGVGLQRYGDKPCPWCEKLPDIIKSELIGNYSEGSYLSTIWGISTGVPTIKKFKEQIDRRKKLVSGYVLLDYIPFDGYHVYRTPEGSMRQGILLVKGSEEEFLSAPVSVVKAGFALVDSRGRVIGKAGWEKDWPFFFKIVGSVKRDINDLIEAGMLEQALKQNKF